MTKKELKDFLMNKIIEKEKEIHKLHDELVEQHNKFKDRTSRELDLLAEHLGIRFEIEDYIDIEKIYIGLGCYTDKKVIKQRTVLEKITKSK